MEAIQTIDYNGHTIKIFPDENPINPREEFDYLGTILYTSNHYLLGDKRVQVEEIEAVMESDDVIFMSVFAYIHSGVVLKATDENPFTCQFDSGQCGIIYCTVEEAKEYWPELSGKDLELKVRECFVAEVDEFSKYLNGEVYGYVIDDGDSCWGFYSVEDAIEEVQALLTSSFSLCLSPRKPTTPSSDVEFVEYQKRVELGPPGGMADAGDLKSLVLRGVPVRVRRGLQDEHNLERRMR